MQLGAGRQTKDDVIDMLAGIRMCRKVGDAVKQGDAVAMLYTSDETKLPAAKERFVSALRYDTQKPTERPYILGVIGGE